MMTSQRGFTLVEVLIALGVFAILSAASVGIIRLATNAQERASEVAGSLSAIERSRAIIRADMLQVTTRRYREPGVFERLEPVLGGANAQNMIEAKESEDEILMAFIRAGWANPDYAQPRASIQHVTYLVRDDNLIRRIRPFVDAAEDTPWRDQILLGGVDDVTLEFFTSQGWQPDWGGQPQSEPPAAIRLTLSHPELGEFHQDFLVGDGR